MQPISNAAGKLSIDRLDAQAITALEGEFNFLQLVNGGEIWQDLRFLSPYARKIWRLRVSGICDSFAGLEELTQLRHLDLDDYVPAPVFDFSRFVHLEFVRMGWSAKMMTAQLFSLPQLREISLLSFKAPNCDAIGLAGKLQKLKLRYSAVDSLDGLGACKALEELRLTSVKKLTSLNGIEACPALKLIEIEKGPELARVDESLQKCTALTEVLLGGKFEVATLAWIRANPMMRRFRSDAMVLDIDWNVLFGAHDLREVAFIHAPGVLPGDDEIKTLAGDHGKNVQWIEHGGTRRAPWIELHFKK